MAELAGTVHHVNLSVSDLDRSTRWYREVFELDEVTRSSDATLGLSKVILRHRGGVLIGLTEHTSNDGGSFDERHCGLDHVALAVTDVDELQSWAERLDRLNIDRSPIKASPLGSLITIRDPDNIQLELFASEH